MTKQLWERLEKESAKAYSYFCFYRDLGSERTTQKVHKKFTKTEDYFRQLSAQHNWVERVKTYDDYLELKIRKANEKELVATSESLLNTVNKMLDLYTIPLEAIEKKLRAKNETGFEGITIKEIMTWVAQNGSPMDKLVKIKMLLEDKPSEKITISLEATMQEQLKDKDIIDIDDYIDEIREFRKSIRGSGDTGNI